MRSSNPALSDKTFEGLTLVAAGEEPMTLNGTVNRTGVLLALITISAMCTWNRLYIVDGP